MVKIVEVFKVEESVVVVVVWSIFRFPFIIAITDGLEMMKFKKIAGFYTNDLIWCFTEWDQKRQKKVDTKIVIVNYEMGQIRFLIFTFIFCTVFSIQYIIFLSHLY